MNPTEYEIRLSLEELVVGLSLIGRPDVAKSILIGNLGEISPDEEKGRLLAANHTLMAKQVLSLQDNQPTLQVEFTDVISSLVEQAFLLRVSRIEGGAEQLLAYYARPGFFVEHRIYEAVVHHFKKIADRRQVFAASVSFLGLDEATSFTCPETELTQQTLETAREQAAQSVDQAQAFLRQADVPAATISLLAEDLGRDLYRGTVMRVEAGQNGQPQANRGCLLLKGASGRAWIFNIFARDGQPFVKIMPFQADQFYALLESFVTP